MKTCKGALFVTGANGHIGNHIVADLLAHGYSVKGSVRDLNDPNKTEHVYAHAQTELFIDLSLCKVMC